MPHKTILFVAILALAPTMPCVAAEVEAISHIDSVVVYPDTALVTRISEADLVAGPSTLIFRNLPVGLDPASLRVTGEAAGTLSIGAVEARLTPVSVKPADSSIETRLKALRAERDGVAVSIDALATTLEMVRTFSHAGPEKLSPASQPLEIAQWGPAFDAIAKNMAKTGDELRLAKARARELDDAIAGLDAARQRGPAKISPAREVSVALDAGVAMPAKLHLTYRISGAGWQPLYDAKLDSGGPGRSAKLELVRRALVTQHTGEGWNDVALTLSTVRATHGTSAPNIPPEKLAFAEPVMRAAADPLARQAPQMQNKALKAPAGILADAMPQTLPAIELAASLAASAFQVAFTVPDRISLGTDGATKTVLLATSQFNPSLLVKSVPALDATAYIEAHIVNEGDMPLLPGTVNVFRDGTYAGQGALPLTAPGGTLDLGFGADDRIKVTRVPVRRQENEPTWFGQTRTETREFRTSVKNLHDIPMKVRIIDRMPFSENTAILIETMPATTPPTEKIVADKRGIMGWTYEMAAGEARDIHLAYRMKWPADRDVVIEGAAPLR